MSITLSALQKQRRDTAANWTAENPTLLAGEIGLESDTGYWKVGNGSSAWNSLAYVPGLGAELPVSRLADGTARQLLQTAANGTDVEWTSNVDVPGTLDVTGAATFDSSVTITGDLTVNGTTTNINTTNLVVEDKNVILGDVATPTDATADGGGITLKGTTDKTINWVDATDAWTLSEHVNIANGKEYRINGTKVLDATSLGSSVLITSANITDGTIVDGDISATAAITHSKLASIMAGSVLMGNATNVPTATALTGDVTINSSGVTAIGSGKVTSTMILDGTIVNADVNASAAIAGTKISPDFGSQTVQTTGIVSHALGTASAPTVTFTGDTNTGIYSPGADQVAISTNGTGRLFVDGSGRLLINASSSTNVNTATFQGNSALGTGTGIVNIALGNTTPGTSDQLGRLQFTDSGHNSAAEVIGQRDGGTWNTSTSRPTSLIFTTTSNGAASTTERMRLDSSGRLGIGTTSPDTALSVQGAAGSTQLTLTDATNATVRLGTPAASVGLLSVGSGQSLAFGTQSTPGSTYTERARIDSSGRLLVGTSSGTATLQVAGTFRAGDSADGGSGGNNATQLAAAPPSGALMAEIVCVGNTYNGATNTHTGFYSACWSSYTNTITVIKDVNHSAGANQGFEAIWSGTQIVIRNKTSMSATQGGRAFIRWIA